jgi:uncharacterized membrane protein (DUF441 family)
MMPIRSAPMPPGPAVPADPASPAATRAADGPGLVSSLRPLAIDVVIPVGLYYLLRDGLGLSLWLSLALSSVIPAVRTAAGLLARRELNVLALLILVTSLAGIGVSFATGDPRLMIAKDSVVSSVVGLAILGSVVLRRPLMSAGLKPFVTRGCADRIAAWDRLAAGSARFRRLELLFSAIWGTALLADCVARLIGAFTLPVSTMVWLGTALTMGAIGVACMVGGVAAGPIGHLIDAETGQTPLAPATTRAA